VGSTKRRRSLLAVNPLRRILFGAPIRSEHHEHAKLPKILGLPVYASDAISSSVYATQEMLLGLSVAGAAALAWAVNLSIAIVALLVVVVISYTQTIFAYPKGGGSYIVARENIGTKVGLIAAAAILIDYVLTVAVSIASGVQNLVAMPFFTALHGHEVAVCVALILLLVLANLRGLKESGTLFAIPTYAFILFALGMIGIGLFGPALFGWKLHPVEHTPLHATGQLGLALILAAFAKGCAAMTGTEAISDGVPSFRKPEALNAAITLIAMACVLALLFIGISVLAVRLGVVYVHGSRPVIDQLNAAVFGKPSIPYYFLQFATVAILVLAANTSFADFPRLSSILARDGFLPRQLANIGDKLTFANGIVLLGVCAVIVIVALSGNTDRLIPLYAIGVFVAFTLSQAGMVMRWLRLRGPYWQLKVAVNGFGALMTASVLAIMTFEKVVLDVLHNQGREFGWVIIVLVVILYAMFRAIEKHYNELRRSLSVDELPTTRKVAANTVLVLVPRVHKGIIHAVDYGKSLTADVRGVHIEIDPASTPNVAADWEKWMEDLPLVILPSPFRSVIGPLLAYLDEVERERPDANITVVVPEFVTRKWWHSLMHANYGALVKLYLLNRRNVIVANVRYFVEKQAPELRANENVGAVAREDAVGGEAGQPAAKAEQPLP
jgi:amino acid transporter